MIGHAAAYHFGLEDFDGRYAKGRAVRTRYPARRLIGFSAEDVAIITRAAMDMLVG